MNTQEKARRIRLAIADCDRFIAIESPRSEDLRPQDAKEYLEFCIAHKERLIAMLHDLAA
jgi:predicted  nucleic acid-binding Zn ribbon protein